MIVFTKGLWNHLSRTTANITSSIRENGTIKAYIQDAIGKEASKAVPDRTRINILLSIKRKIENGTEEYRSNY